MLGFDSIGEGGLGELPVTATAFISASQSLSIGQTAEAAIAIVVEASQSLAISQTALANNVASVDVVSTVVLNLPINCVLIDNQIQYKERISTSEYKNIFKGKPPKRRAKPSFKVTTSHRGYE